MSSSADMKVVLLGHKNVGKTSLFNRYVYQEFGRTSMTIGAYFAMKQARLNDRVHSLAIWDTAGEERFDSLTTFYCRSARAAVVCYDITNAATFENIQRWMDKIAMEGDPNCAVILVGNKLDLVQADKSCRRVDFAEAKRYARSVNAQVVEASAATGENVTELFEALVRTVLKKSAAGGGGGGGGAGAGGAAGAAGRRGGGGGANVRVGGGAEPAKKKCCD